MKMFLSVLEKQETVIDEEEFMSNPMAVNGLRERLSEGFWMNMENENRRRILLVDDNEDFGRMVYDLLKGKGFDVVYFIAAAEALNYLDNGHSIDIALVDLTDALSDSVCVLDVAEKVRAKNSNAKIFIMSGGKLETASMVKQLIESKELQGFTYKPFIFRDIKNLIATSKNSN
jgi:DNA-binding NtrC family response regulator